MIPLLVPSDVEKDVAVMMVSCRGVAVAHSSASG
jgi:hypothetical protein